MIAIQHLLSVGLAVCLVHCASSSAHADLITFDLTDDGVAGAALDGTNGSYTDPVTGVTLSVATTSTLPGNTGSVFNAVGGGAGVDSLSVTASGGDSASELDAEESMTLTITFSDPSIDLTSIDFSLQGGNATGGDQIFLNVDGNAVSLFTGATDYNGSSDLWEPSTPITLQSGDTIVFTAEDAYRIAGITFDTAAVPELSSLALLGVAGLALLWRRRNKSELPFEAGIV